MSPLAMHLAGLLRHGFPHSADRSCTGKQKALKKSTGCSSRRFACHFHRFCRYVLFYILIGVKSSSKMRYYWCLLLYILVPRAVDIAACLNLERQVMHREVSTTVQEIWGDLTAFNISLRIGAVACWLISRASGHTIWTWRDIIGWVARAWDLLTVLVLLLIYSRAWVCFAVMSVFEINGCSDISKSQFTCHVGSFVFIWHFLLS